MKVRFLLIFALLIFIGNMGWSQPREGNPGKEDAKALKESMLLTKEQTKEWKVIQKDFRRKAQAIKEQGGDRKEQRQAIKTLDATRDAKLKAILSEKQWAIYEAHIAARKAERKENRGPRGSRRGGQ